MPKMRVTTFARNPRKRVIKKRRVVKPRVKVTRLRRNDIERTRMRHRRVSRYVIVGFVEKGFKKFKRYFWNGRSFSSKKDDAERFMSAESAKQRATYKIMPRLPSTVARLSIEKA